MFTLLFVCVLRTLETNQPKNTGDGWLELTAQVALLFGICGNRDTLLPPIPSTSQKREL